MDEEQSLRTVLRLAKGRRLQAPGAACKAHHRTGRAGSAVSLGLTGFMRRGWRIAPWAADMTPTQQASVGAPAAPRPGAGAARVEHIRLKAQAADG